MTVVPGDRPRWGEIWAFVDDSGSVAVHRLRSRRGDRLSFRGDGNGWRDRDVSSGRLVGRVAAILGPDGSLRRVGLVQGPILGAWLLLTREARELVRQSRTSPPPARHA